MNKMLVLLNNLNIEDHLPELKEIVKTHGIVKVYLARVSSDFGSRVRSIVAPHKLDMAVQMSEAAARKHFSRIADSLRGGAVDYEPIITGIPATELDDFIRKNDIGLVLTSDGRSGLSRWPSGSLIRKLVPSLYEHAFPQKKPELASERSGRKMLVLFNRLDIDEHLSELKDIAMKHRIDKAYMASVSGASFGSGTERGDRPMTAERAIVYLVRISRGFGSRVRSVVAPSKLDLASRMSDAAANKYLTKIARALSTSGVEAVPIGVGIPAEKVQEYVQKNNIDLVVIGNGPSGLRYWPGGSLTGIDVEEALHEAAAILERRKARTRTGIRTMAGAALQFTVLLVFWLVLSGHYTVKFISFGVISAGLVTLMTNDLVASMFRGRQDSFPVMLAQLGRFLAYIPWLLREIVKANIQVVGIVLNPRLPIEPALLQFDTRLKGYMAQVILANSITITPGSVTVNLEDGRFTVHALLPGAVSGVVDASLQNKIGAIFDQKEDPPVPAWTTRLEELS